MSKFYIVTIDGEERLWEVVECDPFDYLTLTGEEELHTLKVSNHDEGYVAPIWVGSFRDMTHLEEYLTHYLRGTMEEFIL